MKTHYLDSGNFFSLIWVLLGGLLCAGFIDLVPSALSNAQTKKEMLGNTTIEQPVTIISLKSGCGIDSRLNPQDFAVKPDAGEMTNILIEIGSRLRTNVDKITIYKSEVMTSLAVSGISKDNHNVIIVHHSLYNKPRNVKLSVLLHELGHFQNNHFLTWRCGYPRTRELEADEFIGVNMGKFTSQIQDALMFLESISFRDNTYPSKQDRATRIETAMSGGNALNLDSNVAAFRNNLFYELNCSSNLATVEIHFKESISPFKSTYQAYKYLKEHVSKINIFGLVKRGNGPNARVFTIKACGLSPKFNLENRLILVGSFALEPTTFTQMEGGSQSFKIDVVFRNGQEIRIDN